MDDPMRGNPAQAATQATGDRVALSDLLRGALRLLPDAASLPRGAANLLLASPDRYDSLGRRLEWLAQRHPQRIALRFERQAWTYREFNQWVNRIADVLAREGIAQGDCVAIAMENGPQVLACAAATVKLGAVAGLINPQQRGEVLAHSLALIRAKAVIASPECLDALQGAGWSPEKKSGKVMRWFVIGASDVQATVPPPALWQDLAALAADADSSDRPEVQGVQMRDPCFYIFTSGTTGLPKASVMTHYRWLLSLAGLGQMSLRLRGSDVFYCCLPLYHNNALTVSWSAVLGAGCTLALGRRFSASRFWHEVRLYDATAFCYIGELCRYLLNQPPRSDDRGHRVRVIVGNGLRPEIWDAFAARFGIARICEFYGASEGNLAFANSFGVARTAGFCPFPYAIVTFDAESEMPQHDARGHLRRVAAGGIGLLLTEVSDQVPFDGYTDADASQKKLLRDVFAPGDCWFNTGDLVRDQGWRHIQFVDRVGDTFRWKGENVATTEVEAAFNRLPGVEHAVVYGVQVPGCEGRAGMASLSLDATMDAAAIAALAAPLRKALPAYAVPLFLRVRTQQETTATLKFRKAELKQQGFDPARCDEPLYVLAEDAGCYRPLDAAEFQRIVDGRRRL